MIAMDLFWLEISHLIRLQSHLHSLPDDLSDIQQIYRDISEFTGVPVNNGTVEDAKFVSACVPGPGITQLVELGNSLAPYSPVLIQCDVDQNIAIVARERLVNWPGVSVKLIQFGITPPVL